MEPAASVIDRIKGLAKSSERFINGAIRKCPISSNHGPIEILKRLQREAFSDIMKIRDRQDKLEQILSLYNANIGGPFQEAGTHIKGIIDVAGVLLFVENDDRLVHNALDRAGTRTGIDMRFIFKTNVRQKDILKAEVAAGHNRDNLSGSHLALEKVTYLANVNDSLSVIMSPLGAQCNEFGVDSRFEQGRCLGKISSLVPPLFNQQYSGAGTMVKGSNVAASVAELVSGSSNLSTFGQVTFQPLEETRLTLSCLLQTHRLTSKRLNFGTFAIPMGHLKRRKSTEVPEQASSSATSTKADENFSGSVALMLDSQFDESTNISGWVELQKSSKLLQWGVSVSDIPENEIGWGFKAGGKNEGHMNDVQLEGFLNFKFGKNFSLQPGLVYSMDGKNHTPALVFRSSWFM